MPHWRLFPSVPANTRWQRVVVLIAGFSLTGAAANTFGGRAPGTATWVETSPAGAAAVGWELLGGLRSLGADIAWLRLHTAWSKRDFRATMVWMRVAVGLNPQSLFFLVNSARIIAYDTPVWRMAKRAVPENAARRIRREQAFQALSLLEEGAAWHAGNPYWWIERANIALNTADNPEEAAACYRRAAALPGAPYFAARIHAELLLRLGRRGEAYVWLCRLHPSLPPNIPSAQSERVLQGIRELERQLELSSTQLYRPPSATAGLNRGADSVPPDGL